MAAHLDSFLMRALAAHRRRTNADEAKLDASLETIAGREYIAVRESGVAVASYQVQRAQLRRTQCLPEFIW